MESPLTHFAITHAHQGSQPAARSAVRYLRFLREATLERLELTPCIAGRWAPAVPTHPAHLIISSLEGDRWRLIREAELPPDPRIAGSGLSPEDDPRAVEEHFRSIMASLQPHLVRLGGARVTALRVECNREHPVWPSHGECNGNPLGVPFSILDTLRAFGQASAEPLPSAAWNPLLVREEIAPRAPRGMRVRTVGAMVLFQGGHLSAGFSLRRPVLVHLGWDNEGGQAARNRLATRRVGFRDLIRGVSGPLLVGFAGDYGSHRWTGTVEVRGNRVAYRGLRAGPDITVDAVFTVEPRRLHLALSQHATRPMAVIEAEAWRFAFSSAKGMTGVAAVPSGLPGRAGDAQLPAFLAGDGTGALGLRVLDGAAARLQAESYRATGEVTAGLVLCDRPAEGEPLTVPAGARSAALELTVTAFEPLAAPGARRPGPGLRRHWSSLFSCFRPELGGFSNNAVSVHCNQNQHTPIDLAVFTRTPADGPDPVALARFTVGRALAGAGGYGYWRTLYLDSDPVLVSAAGRIHQASPDAAWLRSLAPGLVDAARRMLATMDPSTGLSVCRDLSGNSGSFRWSSNAWDIVGFGHLDAYVNAWTWRAMRNAAALLDDLGDRALAGHCRGAAASIREHYAAAFLNPATGWVACWRSRDGALHDYASPLVNGPACAFGVLDAAKARRALEGLERLRDELGIGSAGLGIPFMLRPIDPRDHLLPSLLGGGATEPTFECYTDGSMGASAAAFYLRALSLNGFEARAARIAAEMDASFSEGVFTGPPGGIGDGREFQTWEGLTSGYEGTFALTFGVLYAIATAQGVIVPPEPEWWPENG